MLSPLWGLVTLLYVTVWGFQVLPILLGLILGAVAGKGIALRPLRSIGARGEYTVSRQNIIARLVVGLAVSGGSLFLLWSFVSDLSFWHAIVEGGYAMNVTAYASSAPVTWRGKSEMGSGYSRKDHLATECTQFPRILPAISLKTFAPRVALHFLEIAYSALVAGSGYHRFGFKNWDLSTGPAWRR